MGKKNKKKFLSCFLVLLMVFSIVQAQDAVYVFAGKGIQFNAGKTKTMEAGTSFKLKVKNLPQKAGNIKYKWRSSKDSIASVSKKGVVNARKPGITEITCNINYSIKKGSKTIKKTKKLVCEARVVAAVAQTPSSVPAPEAPEIPDNSQVPSASPFVIQTVTPVATQAPENMVLPDASRYVKEMGIGINLGNTMEAYWSDEGNKTTGAQVIGSNKPQDYEQCWGAAVTTKEVIDGYRDAGFSTVRIPVYWGNMMENDGKFEISREYMERVKEIAGYCLDDGLYTVINIHHYDEFLIKNYSKNDVIKITEKLWTQIAECFKDYSGYLVFEGFNENLGTQREGDNYTEDGMYDYVNEMNQAFVNAVRSTGGNNTQRLLVVSGFWTNIDKTTDKRFRMPDDTVPGRLMVSVHYIDNAMYWGKRTGSQEWIEYSRGQCELLKNAFTDKGIPVFIGECTSTYGDECIASDALYRESPECLRVIMDMAASYGFVPVLWDVNDSFYSRTEYSVKLESNQKVITEIADRIKSGI